MENVGQDICSRTEFKGKENSGGAKVFKRYVIKDKGDPEDWTVL